MLALLATLMWGQVAWSQAEDQGPRIDPPAAQQDDDKQRDQAKDEEKQDESKKDESKQDESKQDESKQDESKQDESKQDESKQDESKQDEQKDDAQQREQRAADDHGHEPQRQRAADQPAGRPMLGVRLRDNDEEGVSVIVALPGSAAARAGIRPGDQILSVDETRIESAEQLTGIISQKQHGDRLRIKLQRNGEEQTLDIALAAAVDPQRQPHEAMRVPSGQSQQGQAWLGVLLRAEGDEQLDGVRIERVHPRGPAARGGLQPGDVVIRVDDRRVATNEDLLRMMDQKDPNEQVSLVVRRGDEEQRIQVALAAMPDLGPGEPEQPPARRPDIRRPVGPPEAIRPDERRPDARQPEARQPEERRPEARDVQRRQPDAGRRQPDQPEDRRGEMRRPDERGREDYEARRPMPQRGQTSREDRAGRDDSAWLGVILDEEGSRDRRGVAIMRVYPAGPAARAGLRSDDMILQADGQAVNNPQQFIELMDAKKASERLQLVVQRDDERETIDVRLGSRRAFAPDVADDEDDDVDEIPFVALCLEQERHAAQQRARIERLVSELQQEVRALRQEVQRMGRGDRESSRDER
jgi:S1-C subfamily serine protease